MWTTTAAVLYSNCDHQGDIFHTTTCVYYYWLEGSHAYYSIYIYIIYKLDTWRDNVSHGHIVKCIIVTLTVPYKAFSWASVF